MKHKILSFCFCTLLVACGSSTDEQKANSPQEQPPIQVVATVISAESIKEEIISSGTIFPNEEVMLSPETAGKIEQVLFEEGQKVNKGDLLIKLNDRDLQARINRIDERLKLLSENEKRLQALLKAGGVSTQQYDETLTELNASKAERNEIAALIEKMQIKAPFSGTIGFRNVSPGSFVDQKSLIANLVNTDVLKIEFSVPEKFASKVKKSQEISFQLNGNDSIHKATIHVIEPKIDPTTRTLKVRALFKQNAEHLILPGAFVEVRLLLNAIDNAALIPTYALIPVMGGQEIFIYQNGIAHKKQVQTGQRNSDKIHITSGLQLGDTLISRGIMQLREGTKVQIKAFE